MLLLTDIGDLQHMQAQLYYVFGSRLSSEGFGILQAEILPRAVPLAPYSQSKRQLCDPLEYRACKEKYGLRYSVQLLQVIIWSFVFKI